jgi:ubiquinone/menaquinone biosynthesis C-methylase UbiE
MTIIMVKIDNPRLLLAKIRNGDFAHAGDVEAIDIVLDKVLSLISKNTKEEKKVLLDIGCGLGGTAAYIKNKTSFDVHGIDVDADSIEHAKSHYRNISFSKCDVMAISDLFKKNSFDFIYMFNVFYAIREQRESMINLAKVAKPGALLAIFDYTSLNLLDSFTLKDFSGKQMRPIILNELYLWLNEAGWTVLETTDLTEKYRDWYKSFLSLLISNKDNLSETFTDEAYQSVLNVFTVLLDAIDRKVIGGAVVYAIRN